MRQEEIEDQEHSLLMFKEKLVCELNTRFSHNLQEAERIARDYILKMYKVDLCKKNRYGCARKIHGHIP